MFKRDLHFEANPGTYVCKEGIRELVGIDASNKNLKVLPNSIGDTITNGSVSFANNKIKELPERFCFIGVGHNLYLNGNSLRYLPDNMEELKVGGDIHFEDNNIKKVPPCFYQMRIKGNISSAVRCRLTFLAAPFS